jgi:ubiquinone/menaquinone biosynthesis C-methylase UbiE
MSHNPIIDKVVLGLLGENLDGLMILDCGFGYGNWAFQIKAKLGYEPYIVGLEIFSPYIERQSKLGLYDKIVEASVLDIPFDDGYFDVVLASEIIEHLEQKDGLKMINEIERVSKNLVIITTPFGFMKQEECDGNKYQIHRSKWYPSDFIKMGYEVKVLNPQPLTRSVKLFDDIRRKIFNLPKPIREIFAHKKKYLITRACKKVI